jgi:single-stranded-DNA-specific exonuclease
MGPLRGENRVLARWGIDALNTTRRPGLRALIDAAGLSLGKIRASDIGFMLAPRLNAAGRLDHAVHSYKLLLAETAEEAQPLAEELNRMNRERQELSHQVQLAASELAEASGRHEQPLVMLADTEFPAGLVGLVAGRLVEQWVRPVVLIELGATHSRGSARSVPGFSIIDALGRCQELFTKYGGHTAAAGFTLPNANIPALETHLLTLARQQLGEQPAKPVLAIDALVNLRELSWELLAELEQLEPFGHANSSPILMSSGVEVVEARTRGADGRHLSMRLRQQGGSICEAIAFRLGHLVEPLRRHPRIDVAYSLEANHWDGTSRLQLKVLDFRRA